MKPAGLYEESAFSPHQAVIAGLHKDLGLIKVLPFQKPTPFPAESPIGAARQPYDLASAGKLLAKCDKYLQRSEVHNFDSLLRSL